MNVYKSLERMKRRLMKISYELFGIKTFTKLSSFQVALCGLLEDEVGKRVEDFTDEDVRKHAYDYAIWKTCRKLCDVYTSLVELKAFELRDMFENKG